MNPRPFSAALLAVVTVASFPAGATPASGECPADLVSSVQPVAAAVSGAAVFAQAPGVAAFAKAWTRKFAGCVRSAAGTDGRISRKEAERLAARDNTCSLFGDNVIDWLNATGQESVALDKLIRSGYRYAWANGQKAAGPDGKISLEDSARLPADLRDDYLFLRGRLGESAGGPATGSPLVRAELPEGNSLRERAESLDSTWGDENIMNGQAAALAAHVDLVGAPTKDQLESLGRGVLDEYASADELDLQDVKASTVRLDQTNKAISGAARAVACEGMVYDCSPDNIADNTGDTYDRVYRLVRALGAESDIDVVTVTGRSKIEGSDGDNDDGKLWNATTYTFLNRKTGDLVSIYAREGWI